jgi:PAS domain S-box-containing protein
MPFMHVSLLAVAQFLELLPEAAIVVEGRSRVAAANALAANLFGYSPLTDMPISALFAEAPRAVAADIPVAAAECTLIRAGGGRAPGEVSQRWVEIEGRSLLIVIVRDTTERKRAEHELEKSEERLRQAVRVSEIGIFDHDHATDTHYWSARQREIYGWPAGDPITVPAFLARLYPDDRDAIGAGIRAAHDPAGDGSFDVEHRIIRSDGQIRWIATRSITLFAGDGAERRPVRTVGACVDFTERKQGDERRERLAEILDATPDFVAMADASTRLFYLNRAAQTLLGVASRDDPADVRLREHRPEWAARLISETAIPAAIRDGAWRGETAFLAADGREIPFSQVLLAHRGFDGRIAFLSTVARDISREKELEAQFLQAQKMEAIGRLAGGVAHDFNNLLSVILNATEVARHGLSPTHASAEALDDIKSAGERAAELTRRMLAFSRKQVLRPQLVDVNAVLRGMMPMLRRLVSEQIQKVTLLEPELGLIRADPTQLEQVILNLVVNARDAMPKGGMLTIATANSRRSGHAGGPGVTISVSDSGVGMDPGTKARLFEPFFTTKPAGQGTGLGLSTVFGIVKQSGGDIVVESEPGCGTAVRVSFPRVNGPAPGAVAPSAAPMSTDGPDGPAAPDAPDAAAEVILLVDDEAQLRKLVATVLAQSGYRVLVAGGPHEALTLARAHDGRIDLLLTDVMMPQMSGRELAARMIDERPELRVLFTSGYAEISVVDQGILRNGAHLLPKPFSLDELLTTVRRVIGGATRDPDSKR